MSVRIDGASNMALERPTGSHPLAVAAHRERWADEWVGQVIE
jgi:hypothetical protein